MKKELPIYPDIPDVVSALLIALAGYEEAQGNQPSKIAVSYDAFKTLNLARVLDISEIDRPAFYDIPIVITREKGFQISLCGPDVIKHERDARWTYQVLWKAEEGDK